MSDTSAKIKSVEETNADSGLKYSRWKDEIAMAEKEAKSWHEKGRKVVRRFKDERDAADAEDRKFNIFSANVGIMEASLYSRIPKVNVGRKFGQDKDDVARVTSMIIENAVTQDMQDSDCDFDQVMRYSIEDRLVPGFAQAWVRLEVETEDKEMPEVLDEFSGEVIQEAASYSEIVRQEVVIEHVHWEDFIWSPCRTWEQRRWSGRKVYMDQDALVKRFGEEVGKKVPLDYNPKEVDQKDNSPINNVLQQAIIYELWDRGTKKVLWLSKGYPELLDEKDDPLKLEGFEPCPRPLFANLTTSNCMPIPDFVMIQDQYNEMDDVNNRISLLVKAVKVVGVYDSSATGVQRMLQEGTDNTLIPVDSWAMFAEKGGVKGAIDWLPLETVMLALEKLRQAREDTKGQIYELTGIADIVRGNTKASETLGAQQIKAQFASVRIQKLQDESARFAQDILRIKSEIICKHFTPEQIFKMSGVQYYADGQNGQLVQAAMGLIKGPEEDFEWRVNVQADSMAQVDYQMQKQEKVEFTNSIATYLQSAATIIKAAPDMAPIVINTLKFAVSGFKGARELETVIEETLDKIMDKINNPPPAQPDPEMVKMQQEGQMKQAEFAQNSQAKAQDQQIKAADAQMAMVAKQQELAHSQKLSEMELYYKDQLAQMEQMSKAMEIRMNAIESAQNLAHKKAEAEISIKQGALKNG